MTSFRNEPGFAPFKAGLTAKINAGEMPVDGQQKKQPTFYITTTSGMSGWFAVMIWDGMGFEEPYDTGIGRYKTLKEAQSEARMWAASEGVEYRP